VISTLLAGWPFALRLRFWLTSTIALSFIALRTLTRVVIIYWIWLAIPIRIRTPVSIAIRIAVSLRLLHVLLESIRKLAFGHSLLLAIAPVWAAAICTALTFGLATSSACLIFHLSNESRNILWGESTFAHTLIVFGDSLSALTFTHVAALRGRLSVSLRVSWVIM